MLLERWPFVLVGDSDRACKPKKAFVLFLNCGRAHREKDLFEMQIPDLPKGNQVTEVDNDKVDSKA